MMNVVRQQASQRALNNLRQHVRGMATEKQILMRITATSNIAKITKSMKMVSAAKLRGAQNRLNAGRPFASWLENVGGAPAVVDKEGLPEDRIGKTNLMVVITSDRGLCGGCNSYIAKATKNQVSAFPETVESDVFVVGEKGRAQLRRTMADKFKGSVTECWQNPPSFAMASTIAEGIIASGEYEKAHLVYNNFVSAITYTPNMRTVQLGAPAVAEGSEAPVDPLLSYEFEPDNREEVMKDLAEFQLASGIFHGMIESNTSEESSRMAAMENATNNAQELIQSLTLTYNKARQARITTELIEIISGAASLDG